MTTFRFGPAQGSTLLLLRGPAYLRLAEAPGRADAARFIPLDSLRDEPGDYAGFTFHAYRRVNPRERLSIFRGRSKYVCGEYEYADPQPGQDVMASNEKWQEWVKERKAAESAQAATPTGDV